MKSKITLLLIITFSLNVFAQFPSNTYQSTSNEFYWKNRKPYEGYWQQDVHYTINAELNDSTDIITGKAQLAYTNNSPDALTFVFFHFASKST